VIKAKIVTVISKLKWFTVTTTTNVIPLKYRKPKHRQLIINTDRGCVWEIQILTLEVYTTVDEWVCVCERERERERERCVCVCVYDWVKSPFIQRFLQHRVFQSSFTGIIWK